MKHGVNFSGFNVWSIQKTDLYENIKTMAQFPTFPQLYIRGELIGGVDVCRELFESGELQIVQIIEPYKLTRIAFAKHSTRQLHASTAISRFTTCIACLLLTSCN